MKIAFVSLMRIFPWGGSEDLWYKAAKLAIKRGHTVYSLTQRWSEVPPRIAELAAIGVHTHFYEEPAPTLARRAIAKLGRRTVLATRVPEVPADIYVISCGSTWDFINNRQLVAQALAPGKKLVLISQHNFENGNIPNLVNRHYAHQVIESAEKFYFVSRRNLLAAERQIVSTIKNAEVISNPLNSDNRTIISFPHSPVLTMACVARLQCDFKGQDLLLQSLSHPDWAKRDYKLNFYGSGPDLEYLESLVRLYNLQDKVSFRGHVNRIDEIWEENQVLVMPSLSEGTPLSLVEAMVAGRAALATNVGDNAHYVVTGETGILLETPSLECLHAGLAQLWQAKSMLQQWGENAHRRALELTDLNPERTLLDSVEQLQRN